MTEGHWLSAKHSGKVRVARLPDSMLDSKEDIARWREAARRGGMGRC